MTYISHYFSPLGDITMASDGNSLIGLWFAEQKYFGDTLSDRYETKDLSVFEETRKWLDLYFDRKDPGFIPSLKIETNPFRKRVLEILLTIPYGRVMSYGQIAKMIAEERGIRRMSAQAVGNAVAHNPISLIIPCHRVIGSDGSLTGYASGIDKKIRLLEMEGGSISNEKYQKCL